ncbi:MAG TPA: caspase family protein [Steroidobacteraceae bacterium]|jgi:hypothetical protein
MARHIELPYTRNRSKRWIGLALPLIVYCAGASTGFSQAVISQEGGAKRALLIGINEYEAVPALRGSINDVETMREVLESRWGFPEANIRVLTDRAATRAGILAALEDLVTTAGPRDTVYLHYSGHGSEVEDLNGDEENGFDQTLVPQDGRSGSVRDIIDDEIAMFIARLQAQSAIIVLDSCHSGTATRSFDIRARSVPRDTRIELYKQAAKTRAFVPAMRSRFVVLSATAATEEALDGPIEGRYAGFFTHSLAKSMSMAPPGATLAEVFAGVARELNRLQAQIGRVSMPEPQLEAPPALLDQPLFTPLIRVDATAPVVQEPRLPWLALLPLTQVSGRLEKAALLGAAAGSKWAIYPPGETQFPPGAALGVATVERLDGRDAIVSIETGGHPVDPGSRVVALLPAPAASMVPVRLMAMPADREARVKQLLSRDVVKIVGANEPARFLVDASGSELHLLTADGLHIVGRFGYSGGATAADLTRLLHRSINVNEILTLDNPASRLLLAAHIAGRAPLGTRGVTVVADTQAAELHVRRPTEIRSASNSLQLEVRVNADAYVTIIDVDPAGEVNLLFPNDYQQPDYHRDGAVRSGEPALIPDSLGAGNRAGFYWDYSPPSGVDTLRIFASTDLATANTIRRRVSAMRRGAAQGATGTRAIQNGVIQLRRDFVELATRDIVLIRDQGLVQPGSGATTVAPDWAATSLTVQVSE